MSRVRVFSSSKYDALYLSGQVDTKKMIIDVFKLVLRLISNKLSFLLNCGGYKRIKSLINRLSGKAAKQQGGISKLSTHCLLALNLLLTPVIRLDSDVLSV